jgi:beta-N-acetylhexosaminidase
MVGPLTYLLPKVDCQHPRFDPVLRDVLIRKDTGGGKKMRDLLMRAASLIFLGIGAFQLSPIDASAGGLLTVEDGDRNEVDKLIKEMSMEEKIGQMFIVGFEGTEAKGDIKELIEKYHIGGGILYERNIKDQRPIVHYTKYSKDDDPKIPEAVARLTNSLQKLVANKTGKHIPLFIAADQENGRCLIVERGITILPGNMALGQTRKCDFARRAGRVTGEELRAMGINMNLAPVVDVVTNPANHIIGNRSFGGNPEIVTQLGTEFMKGLHEGGAVAVGKHFPGHGDTATDPHTGLPKITCEKSRIQQFMLPPFESLIKNGVEAILTAHIEVPALGTQVGLPASLSKDVIEKWLRSKNEKDGIGVGLGDKIVMTDDLTAMKAVTMGRRPITDSIRDAVAAGNDIILLSRFAPTTDLAFKDFTRLLTELKEEYQDPEKAKRIDQSVRRILSLKMRIEKTLDPAKWMVEVGRLGTTLRKEDNLRLAQGIADDSIVLVTEKGDPAYQVSGTQFSNHRGPLKTVPRGEKILVVSSVNYPPDLLYEELEGRKDHEIVNIRLISGYRNEEERRDCRTIWGEEMPDWKDERVIVRWKNKILRAIKEEGIRKENPIIFSLTSLTEKDPLRLLKRVAEAAKDYQIIAVGLKEPNLMDEQLLFQKNITFLSAASGVEPSIKAVVKALYGELNSDLPHPVDYVSVSVGGKGENIIANRETNIGARIINGGRVGPLPLPLPARWRLPNWFLVGAAVLLAVALAFVGRKYLVLVPKWCRIGLTLILASLVGALCGVGLSPEGIPAGWLYKKPDGSMALGFGPRVLLFSLWGVFLYIMALLAAQILSKLWEKAAKILESVRSVPMYEYLAAVVMGMIGGLLGPSLVKDWLLPLIQKFR